MKKYLSSFFVLIFVLALISCSDDDGDEGIKIDQVVVSPDVGSVAIGETTTFIAVILPQGATGQVIWSSSDENIATVADGIVTGVADGIVTITATVGDKKGSATVNVGSAAITVEEFELDLGTDDSDNPITYTDLKVGETFQLEWKTDPQGGHNQARWTSADEETATVDETTGLITAVSEGSTIITGNIDGVDPVEFSLFNYVIGWPTTDYINYAANTGLKFGSLDYNDDVMTTNVYTTLFKTQNAEIETGQQTATVVVNQFNTGLGDVYVVQMHIDFNGDNQFDDDTELVGSEDWAAEGEGEIEFTFTVPDDAQTTGRIRTGVFFKSGHAMVGGLGNAESGQWVDYSYTIN